MEPKSDGAIPWDPETPVPIPETGFHISAATSTGSIFLRTAARRLVRDYKTGKCAKG